MCRSIQPLFNMEPPTTADDVRAAALQYVRKISGYAHPSQANAPAFDAAVAAITAASRDLLRALATSAPPRSRAARAAKARDRAAQRRPH
ncbi:MAG TPA: DUF2277 domain-containing protein [Ktedonobacterales bacterium]|jgi:hypothetical protein